MLHVIQYNITTLIYEEGLLKNPVLVILSEAKDLSSHRDSSAFGLRMTTFYDFFSNPEDTI
jgi:hypothetical protein